jgi:hypothetical protein
MNILLKSHGTEKCVVMGYDEFKERIRKGEVFPADQVQDRVLTNEQWWTVDNLRIFHRLSPARHAKGPHLVAREKAEEEKRCLEEVHQMQAAQRQALASKFFCVEHPRRNILMSSLFEFLTACHEDPLASEEFAVRFSYMPSFHPALFVRAARRRGNWELHYKAADSETSETGHSLLANNEAQQLIDLIECVNLTEMPDEDDVIGLDGATWSLEIARQGIYALRQRWSPLHDTSERELAEFVALGKYLVQLSKLRQSKDELY